MADGFALGDAGAVLSECGRYRYTLWRRWSRAALLVVCMLNPSTADASNADATITKLCGFARRLGYGGIFVVNLFAFRATKPAEMRRSGYSVGPENDRYIAEAIELAKSSGAPFVCAWGAGGSFLERDRDVLREIRIGGVRPVCFRITPKSGAPEHPLYIPYSEALKPYEVPRG